MIDFRRHSGIPGAQGARPPANEIRLKGVIQRVNLIDSVYANETQSHRAKKDIDSELTRKRMQYSIFLSTQTAC
jgi:hypothetical protein